MPRRHKLIFLLSGLAFFFGCTASIVYYPDRTLRRTPGQTGLAYEDVRITTKDGVLIHGWWVPADKHRATVLFCHGNAGNVSHCVQTLVLLKKLGCSTFIFDYRGFGKSKGSPTEQGTYADAEAAWEYLTKTRGLAPRKIILMGRSLGGAVAAALASKQAPGALVLESSFTSMQDLAKHLDPLGSGDFLTDFHYDTKSALKDVHCPVLIIHSADDEIVPISQAKELFDAANPPKDFIQIRGPHATAFLVSARAWSQAIDEFISRHFGQVLPPGSVNV